MSANLRLHSLRSSPPMPEIGFLLVKDIFRIVVEELRSKPKH
jgi:hypothetical protein